jgi:hypothetical protein
MLTLFENGLNNFSQKLIDLGALFRENTVKINNKNCLCDKTFYYFCFEFV